MRISKVLALFFSSVSALPVLTLPWFGHISLDGLVAHLGYTSLDVAENRTIYEVLKDDRQYSRLMKVIDLSESVVDLLSDPSKNITFFAVSNSRAKPPHHHRPHHGHHGHDESLIPSLLNGFGHDNHDFGDLVQRVEEFEEEPESPDKEKRRETLARIAHKILAYHILPKSYRTADLVQNSTYATNLTLDDGSMDSKPLRLSILSSAVPPRLRINMFVAVTKRDVKARNGVIHRINHPLLPPPSIFQETFFVPEVFSFFTSAIQHVGLTGAIDLWSCSRNDGHNVSFSGATATTAFAPTSSAFKRLPKKLRRYLFSPFGRNALKKLLEYHIIPNSVLYTDYFHNSTSDATSFSGCLEGASETQFVTPAPALLDRDVENLSLFKNTGPHLELVYEYRVTLPTLLRDHHLQVHVARYKSKVHLPSFPQYFTHFKVNGHHVAPLDIPAQNGALHVVSTILDPRKGRGHHTDLEDDETAWEDWEEWFPQWAMED